MTYTEMYLSLLEKYGEDSPQLKKYKEYLAIYIQNRKIMQKIYKILIEQ